MATTTNEVAKATALLEKSLRRQYELTKINRSGDRISVPETLKLIDAVKVLTAIIEEQDSDAQRDISIVCHPDDGLVCFADAMAEAFGNLDSTSVKIESFFGEFVIPAETKNIQFSLTESRVLPIGAVKIPGFPVEFKVAQRFNSERPARGTLIIRASYKKMHEPLVEAVEKLTREKLKKFSIFRGKAINSKFEFIDLSNTRVAIHSEQEERQIDANLLAPIIHTKMVEKSGIPMRRSILLSGRYGTGKTLTATKVADVCVQHGWTFMNVLPGDSVVTAINFANDYQPCVVFFEDIDAVTNGGRDEQLNAILNTVDGVLSKNSKVIVIATTNHVESINKAMLRPGRIDEIIEMGIMDKQSVHRLVAGVAGMELDHFDAETLWTAAGGNMGDPLAIYTPAYIVEAVNKSRLYAISRGGNTNITTEDVASAMNQLRAQFNLMMLPAAVKHNGVDLYAMESRVQSVEKAVDEIKSISEKIYSEVR